MKRLSTVLMGAAVAAFAGEGAANAAVAEKTDEHWGGPMSQHVWLDAQAGVEEVQLQTFSANGDTLGVGLLPASGVGPTLRAGAGVRFGFLTLGLRGRVATFENESASSSVTSWNIWSLDAELGVRVPLRTIEPHIALAGGYSSFGGFNDAVNGLGAGLDVHGVDGRLDAGVDFWVTHALSLGVNASGELLALARPGVSVRDLATPQQVGTLNEAKARVLEANGSSVGSALALTANLGVHF
ncbi:MAG TPA: hypothetical protein VF765_14915 [Polyangiaceae bacterium]